MRSSSNFPFNPFEYTVVTLSNSSFNINSTSALIEFVCFRNIILRINASVYPNSVNQWIFVTKISSVLDKGQIKEDEMGRACSTNRGEEECI
jgi:hypothetical protein